MKLVDPGADIYLVSAHKENTDAPSTVLNYRHEFWVDGDEPLYPLFSSEEEPVGLYEIFADGETYPIPQACTSYLKHDQYTIKFTL